MNKNLPLIAAVVVSLGLACYVLYLSTGFNGTKEPIATTTVTAVEQTDNEESPLDTEPNEEDVQEEQETETVQNKWEGTHIMADGTIMTKAGEKVLGASILANGTIRMSDGTIVTPAFDLRSNSPTGTSVNAPKHVVINVAGVDFEYDIKQIKVKKGDTVTINFKSNEGFHDWVVDEFNVATQRVNEGGTTSVTFVADKVGTFQYYCSVMQHRQMGMVGYLVVE